MDTLLSDLAPGTRAVLYLRRIVEISDRELLNEVYATRVATVVEQKATRTVVRFEDDGSEVEVADQRVELA